MFKDRLELYIKTLPLKKKNNNKPGGLLCVGPGYTQAKVRCSP